MKIFYLLLFLIYSWYSYGQQRFEFTHFQMGTHFKIKLYAPDSTTALQAVLAAFKRIDELNQIMSDYVPNSEVNRLSKTSGRKRKIEVSKDLWKVLAYSKMISKKTDGAFDVTVGRASRLWRKAFLEQSFPKLSRVRAAKKTINFEFIKLDKRKQAVTLTHSKMRLDLGGIAKGYAIDQAMIVLNQHGIKQALIVGGNDMAASDPPPNQVGWPILVPTYEADKTIQYDTAFLNGKAISIAGATDNYIQWGGRRFYNIINPTTGLGTNNQFVVTVMAESCMESDALATAFCVMDSQMPKRLLPEFDKVFLVIQEPGVRHTF